MSKPGDFDPYRAEISGCECPLCRECAYTISRGMGDSKPAEVLLAALRADTHRRVELAERIAELKAERFARVAAACASGRSERYLAGLHRGYFTSRDSETWPYESAGPMQSHEFVVGLGIGMSAGAHAARERGWRERVDRAERARAARVEQLIAADERNRCTYYRVAAKMCAHHQANADMLRGER